jgi:hypothetical protein
MVSGMEILRFFRDTEARLRELAQQEPGNVSSGLLQVADDISVQAAGLKEELIANRVIC